MTEVARDIRNSVGPEWLGEMPRDWGVVPLKRLASLYAGGTPDRENRDYWDDGTIPWLNSGAVNQRLITEPSSFITEEGYRNSSAKWIPKGALVMALAGQGKTKGMVGQLAFQTTCNQSMAAIVPSEKIHPRFLLWWLSANYETIRNLAGGEHRDGLNLEIVGSILCPVPPIRQQNTITSHLDHEVARLDELVAAKERLLGLLAEKRRALITRAVTRGLDSDAPLRDSCIPWLGQIPAHWRIARLKHFADIYYGLSQPPEYAPSGIPFLRATNVKRGRLFKDGLVFVDEADLPDTRALWLRTGDIIVVRSGAYTGDSALVTEEWSGAVAGYDMVVRTRRLSVPEFVSLALLCQYVLEAQIDPLRMRAAQPHLNAEELGDISFALPPICEQHTIVAHISVEAAKIDALRAATARTIALLKERRAALISAAVTGQIRVDGAV